MDEEREEGCNCPPPGAPAWMATFGDMMSLLVTFFVLLLSFANMDIVKFKQATGSLKNAFGVQYLSPGEWEARSTTPFELSDHESTPFIQAMEGAPRMDAPTMDQRMMGEVQKLISAHDLSKIVEAETGERGVTVRVKGQMLYEAGSDSLQPEAYIFLDEIAELARGFPYAVSIEGHTDDVPIHTERFPSNWHLSTARAIAALRYLVDSGGIDRSRLSAAGYADTHPLVPNDSPENRAKNRRVEFVYLRGTNPAIRNTANGSE